MYTYLTYTNLKDGECIVPLEHIHYIGTGKKGGSRIYLNHLPEPMLAKESAGILNQQKNLAMESARYE